MRCERQPRKLSDGMGEVFWRTLEAFRRAARRQRTIDTALAFGFTRIELTVRETNVNAISLYKKLGFETEGLHRKAIRIEGRYENLLSMAFVTG